MLLWWLSAFAADRDEWLVIVRGIKAQTGLEQDELNELLAYSSSPAHRAAVVASLAIKTNAKLNFDQIRLDDGNLPSVETEGDAERTEQVAQPSTKRSKSSVG